MDEEIGLIIETTTIVPIQRKLKAVWTLETVEAEQFSRYFDQVLLDVLELINHELHEPVLTYNDDPKHYREGL